jgi:hypothetical protein
MGEADNEPDEKDDDPPFDPDEKPSKPVTPGKHGQGYSQAKHLAQQGMKKAMNVQELAEFIHTFYDRDSATFPKGPEGVCTMVGKKFGPQAEAVARKMVERMAPQQTTENNPELQELARLRELSGMKEASISQSTYSAVGSKGYDFVMNKLVELPGTEVEPDEENQMATVTILGNAHKMTVDAIKQGLEMKLIKPIADFSHRKVGALAVGTPNIADKESVNPELESIRRLSGISQGLGF